MNRVSRRSILRVRQVPSNHFAAAGRASSRLAARREAEQDPLILGALEQLAAVGVHLDIPVPPAIDNGGADSSDSSDDDDTGGGGGGGGGGVGSVAAPVADVRKRGRGGRGGGRAGAAPSRRGGGRGRYVNALLADAAAAAGDGALAVGAGVPAPPPVGVRLNIVALGGGVYGAPGAFVPDILVGAPDVEDPPAAPAAAGDGAPIVGPQRAQMRPQAMRVRKFTVV